MKSINLFDYPNNIEIIFEKLNENEITCIIVGGYIRDYLLDIPSKDIDIELYGVKSFEQLEELLAEFGNVNNVGKSFGVCKLSVESLEIDFTLPRTDNKISAGHSGFSVEINKNLDFKSASSRRDFTINTIGYDTKNKKVLDPYNGINDIKNKIIKAVDLEKFAEDPLRVFRLVGFSSRFNFKVEKELFVLSKKMCNENILSELARERIYTEVKKILLKSPFPSKAFYLLQDLNALRYLQPLDTLSSDDFSNILYALDRVRSLNIKEDSTNLLLMLSILCYKFDKHQVKMFVQNLTSETKLMKNIFSLIETNFEITYNDSEVLHLATKTNIEHFLLFSEALNNDINKDIFQVIKTNAKRLNVLNAKEVSFLRGQDILDEGIKPSKKYSEILSQSYEAQLNLKIRSTQEAKAWLKEYLLS